MDDQYVNDFVDFSSVSPQSKFLESNPAAPDPTDTLYLDRHITTNSDGSKNYRLVGCHIVLEKDNPNQLWKSLHIDRQSEKNNPQKPLATKLLEIYCDILEVHGEFSVPEADVSIFARQIIWATPDAAINTSPLEWTESKASDLALTDDQIKALFEKRKSDIVAGKTPEPLPTGGNGTHGRNAGNFSVFVSEVVDPFQVDSSVVIYSDPDYKGQSKVLEIGTYNTSELGITNDSLSSLQVPKGLQVTLYEHSDFQGRSKIFTEDASSVGDDFNNVTSSIKVSFRNCLIANGGNGQNAGAGEDDKGSVDMNFQTTAKIEIDGGMFQTPDSVVNFDPPATYYEYFWFATDWGGKANDKNYGKNVVSMSDFSDALGLGFDDNKILESMKNWGDNSRWPCIDSNSLAPGRPGNAGNGGTLKTNNDNLLQSIMNLAGQGGIKAKDSKGITKKFARYQVHVLAPPTRFANMHNRLIKFSV